MSILRRKRAQTMMLHQRRPPPPTLRMTINQPTTPWTWVVRLILILVVGYILITGVKNVLG